MANLFQKQDDLLSKNFTHRDGEEGCRVIPVGRRRDGKMRHWCVSHKANATGKYGVPLDTCVAAGLPAISQAEIVKLDIDDFPGGIALWGAVPPVYDTTRLPLDRGIHVHSRKTSSGEKIHDHTFREVRLSGGNLPASGVSITEIDAVYFMVSTVFGFKSKYVECTLCGYPHLDKDWFSIHPHRRHLCAGCGKHFRDISSGIGNPISRVRALMGLDVRPPIPIDRKLILKQADYPGGIQIWGSNAAIVWTGENREEEGIHVHAFKNDSEPPIIDETYSSVAVDGLSLDAEMVRVLMAQNALPHIVGRVVTLICKKCGNAAWHKSAEAFTPSSSRPCRACGGEVQYAGRLRNVISNPLVKILEELAKKASRAPQKNDLGFRPETL